MVFDLKIWELYLSVLVLSREGDNRLGSEVKSINGSSPV